MSVVTADARRASAAAAAVAALVIALVSGLRDVSGTWDWLSGQRRQFEQFSAQERAQEPGTAQFLPVDAFDFAVTKGGFAAGVDRATAGRIFSRYYLLPSIQVDTPAKADVVLAVGVDPHSLGVPLGPVQKFSGGNYFVARVRP